MLALDISGAGLMNYIIMAAKKKFNVWTHIRGILIVTLIGTSISFMFSRFPA